ncbi:hypothetical protein OSH11_08390 [Kaistia dalseonensis]|uniref:Vancomycin resistance protein YoaR n=1 Tax=Kaistia dalseonensis TaxID=410840 RepID=A0ABU0H4R1_9HYPH|nr:hypothetical protein [Kaistia dalseonensis]MCX5494718.1 hypothetical protein [Kaistia dalseonensis]MDQ0437299.1 vancomycin resistance protein YoaR [Kaistia dalseonensis]
MENATYYIVPDPAGTDWTVHHDGTDLGRFSSYDDAVKIAVKMAESACEIGFASSAVSVRDKGDFEVIFRCEPATAITAILE